MICVWLYVDIIAANNEDEDYNIYFSDMFAELQWVTKHSKYVNVFL